MSAVPKKLKIPMRLKNGCWEFAYGGSVSVVDGAEAELVIKSADIADKQFLKRVAQKVVSLCLPRGTQLMVALSVQELPSNKICYYRADGWQANRIIVNARHLPSASAIFLPVTLGPLDKTKKSNLLAEDGGLWMIVSGLGEHELFSSSVYFPEELEMEPAQSLNHAFTKLSERFETHRLSHTGSVYSRVFYKESDSHWYPLEELKNPVLGNAQYAVRAAGWKAIESQLDWGIFRRSSHKDLGDN